MDILTYIVAFNVNITLCYYNVHVPPFNSVADKGGTLSVYMRNCLDKNLTDINLFLPQLPQCQI